MATSLIKAALLNISMGLYGMPQAIAAACKLFSCSVVRVGKASAAASTNCFPLPSLFFRNVVEASEPSHNSAFGVGPGVVVLKPSVWLLRLLQHLLGLGSLDAAVAVVLVVRVDCLFLLAPSKILPGKCRPVNELGVLASGLAAVGSGLVGNGESNVWAWAGPLRADPGSGESRRLMPLVLVSGVVSILNTGWVGAVAGPGHH